MKAKIGVGRTAEVFDYDEGKGIRLAKVFFLRMLCHACNGVTKMIIEIIKGDITKIEADIIVNAANSSLLGGGGVDGAIHRAGGSDILNECIKIKERQDGCKTGEAVFTNAGKLKAKYIIHTVGPVWNCGNEEEKNLLKNCYINSMKIAKELHAGSIAFPNISTGVYRFPKETAADIVEKLFTSNDFKKDYDDSLRIIFVNYDDENYELYKEKFAK